MLWGKNIAGAMTMVAMLLVIAGCGSGSGSSSSADPAKASAGSAKEFISPGGENKYAEFGEEGSPSEREAASKILEENLKARAAGNWAKQCASLSPAGIKKLESEVASPVVRSGCVPRLKALAEPLAKTAAVRVNTMAGPIAALRVKGDKGFALYHGTHGKDFAMAMEKVNGSWMVDALLTTEVP